MEFGISNGQQIVSNLPSTAYWHSCMFTYWLHIMLCGAVSHPWNN